MSGGGGSSKTTTQNYSPAEAARRTQVMDAAQALYNAKAGQYGPGSYTGAQVVPFSQASLQGQQSAMDAASQAATSNTQTADALTYGLSGAMDVTNNPYLNKAVDAALGRITNQYTDPNGVLATIRSGAEGAGQYGGSRQGVAEGIAARDYANALGDTANQMYSAAYDKGQDTFAKTLALAPSTIQAYALPSQWQSAVGTQQETLSQAMEDYNAAVRDWNLNGQWEPLNKYADIVYNGGGSQSVAKGITSGGSNTSNYLTAAALAALMFA